MRLEIHATHMRIVSESLQDLAYLEKLGFAENLADFRMAIHPSVGVRCLPDGRPEPEWTYRLDIAPDSSKPSPPAAP